MFLTNKITWKWKHQVLNRLLKYFNQIWWIKQTIKLNREVKETLRAENWWIRSLNLTKRKFTPKLSKR